MNRDEKQPVLRRYNWEPLPEMLQFRAGLNKLHMLRESGLLPPPQSGIINEIKSLRADYTE